MRLFYAPSTAFGGMCIKRDNECLFSLFLNDSLMPGILLKSFRRGRLKQPELAPFTVVQARKITD